MVISKEILDKALWRYNNSRLHVLTSESGLHSDIYLNTDIIVSDPETLDKIIKDYFLPELSKRNIKPDWVVSYPPFGLAIAYSLAKACKARFGYVDLKEKICNFEIRDTEKVIVVADDIYSGDSIRKTIEILAKKGVKVIPPILTLGSFSGIWKIIEREVVYAITNKGNLFPEKECPMCKAGSRAVLPRPNWDELIRNESLDNSD
ncbi:hypothetical protein H6503_06670 [Candidatus Woesearchaeota archaeon]|nr:hypothetical protein [Candidatus Woesearchaeota archaeon]